MAELSVFIPDKVNTARWEPIGNGRCLYIRYMEKPKLFGKRKVKKHLQRANGTHVLQADFAKKLSLPLLSGSGEKLVLALCDRLVPKAAWEDGLTIALGETYDTESILEIARHVRTLELIAEGDVTALTEKIEEETGLTVPVYREYQPAKKIYMRLPGGMFCGKNAIDVSEPKKTCLFAPPEALRPLCKVVGTDGDTLEALLRFFGFSYGDADIFLSKITKLCRK